MFVSGYALAWEALFVFDVMIVVLTWASVHRTKSPSQSWSRDLATLVVRDGEPVSYVRDRTAHKQRNLAGTIYFVYVACSWLRRSMLIVGSVMACANFANVMTFYVSLSLKRAASILITVAASACKCKRGTNSSWRFMTKHQF